MKIALFGGTGFVGSYIIDELLAQKMVPRILVREESQFKLLDPGKCELIHGDLKNENAIRETISGSDAVIYNVGIIREYPSKGITFKAMVKFIPNIIAGYVNSDEISLIWPSRIRWQGNRLLKICSIAASFAGKELNNSYRARAPLGSVYESTLDTLYFDCRAFLLNQNEVLPYLQSRQNIIVYGNLHWKAKQIVEDRIVQQHKSESSKRRLLINLNADFEEDPKRFSYGVLYTKNSGINSDVGDFRQWSRLDP